MTLTNIIRSCIESQLKKGKKKFVIYPFGEVGMEVKKNMQEAYNIQVDYIIDNNLCKYNPIIKPIEFLKNIDCSIYTFILACTNHQLKDKLRSSILKYINEDNLVDLMPLGSVQDTKTGKYSYGPLCNHHMVESVGAFCSFAEGTDVVTNHAVDYISTHPFIFFESLKNFGYGRYSDHEGERWHLNGIAPNGKIPKLKKSKIGNDVWFGRNVIVTNGADIGNGVIAGAGSVITKDIPDYAVVVGVPAKIIRYRYTAEQIEDLKKIQWWNWSDEDIITRYNDFFLPINEFIKKYK